MRRLPLLLWLVLCGGCAASYPPLAQVETQAATTCVVGATVFAGPDLTPLDTATVCFADAVITHVTDDAAFTPPAGARRVEARGAFLVPGLIDTHVHVTATDAPPWLFRLPDPEHNLAAWLAAGITTVYDLGGDPAELRALDEAVAQGTVPGPRILFGHEPITAPGGHPIPAIGALLPWPLSALLQNQVPTLARAASADALVGDMNRRGAQFVKIIHDALPPGAPRLDQARLKALVEAGHARDMPVFVHIGSNQDALDAIAAGADHLAHGVYKEPVTDALVAAMRKAGTTVTVTVAGFDNTREMAAGRYRPAATTAAGTDPEIAAAVTGEAGRAFAGLEVLGDFSRTIADRATLLANVRALHEGGVTVLPGTDSPIAGVFPGGSFHEELSMMQEAGIDPLTVLRRATVDAAARLKAPAKTAPFGVLAVGARADVLVLDDDPRQGVAALQHRRAMFAAGREVATPR